jgi:hypothetical protein
LDVCLEEGSKKGRKMNRVGKESRDEEINIRANKLMKNKETGRGSRRKGTNKQTNKSTTEKN